MPVTTTDETLRGFLEREQPRLVSTLSSYVGDRDLAEELAAEALARVVRDWDTISAMAAPGAYAHRTAINMANSWFRRQAAHRRALARKGQPQLVHVDPDIVTATVIREAVAALPRQQRAAVALHHLAGFTTAEVADQLGVAPATVRSNLHHARRSLREALGGDADLAPAVVEPKVPREEVVARGTRLGRRRTAATTVVVLMVVAAAIAVVVRTAQEPEQPIVDEPPQDTEQPRQDTPPDLRPDEEDPDSEQSEAQTAEPVVVVRGCGWPATVGMQGDGRTTALHVAVLEGDIAEAEAQLRQGADPNVVDERQADTPLGTAVFSGCTELVELLLDAGADPALVSAAGTPPVTHAVNVGAPAIVDLLLDAGADPSQWSGTAKSMPALHEAVGTGRLSLLPRLLEHATDVDVAATGADPLETGEDVGLGSALEFAADGRTVAVAMLLEAGATPTRTAVYRAVLSGHTDIVVALVAAGASTEAAPSGRTFADVADEHGHSDLADYLRSLDQLPAT